MSSDEPTYAELALNFVQARLIIAQMEEERKAAKIFTGILVDRLGGSVVLTVEEIQMFMQAKRMIHTEHLNDNTARYFVKVSEDAEICECQKCKNVTAAYSEFKH